MIEPTLTFEKVTVGGKACSQYVHEMRWLGQIIEFELVKKRLLVEQAKNEPHYDKQMKIQKKIRHCKAIITGCAELIKDYRSALKKLQRNDPNNMKKKTL